MCASNVQQASVVIEDTAQTDIYVRAEAIPTQVKSNRNLDVIFEIQNKKTDPISDVKFLAYDQCLFSGNNSKNFTDIETNTTKEWSWKWMTGPTGFDMDCKIKFKVDYLANFTRTQIIPVLTESEYNQRDAAGTLSSIPATTYSSTAPIDIIISFSQSFPFEEGDKVTFFIDYVNKEKGLIDKFDARDVRIKTTGNMNSISCNDYILSGNELVLNKELKFMGGRAPRSTCSFTAAVSGQSPLDVQTLTLTAKYKYSLDYSLTVKVSPK
jgi:hypothetical protein